MTLSNVLGGANPPPLRLDTPEDWQRFRTIYLNDQMALRAWLRKFFTYGRDTTSGALDHGQLAGLTDDDHVGYMLKAAAAVTNGNLAVWDGTGQRNLKDGGAVPTQYTDEMAQDAVGAMVDSSLTYTDATPLLGLSTSAKASFRDYQIGPRIWFDDNTGTFAAADTTLTNNTNENGHWSGATVATGGTRKIVLDFPVPEDLSPASSVLLMLYGYINGAVGASDRLRMQYRWRLLASSDPLTTGGSTGTVDTERQIGGAYTSADVIFFSVGTVAPAAWTAGSMVVGSITRAAAASNEYAGSFMPAWLRLTYTRT